MEKRQREILLKMLKHVRNIQKYCSKYDNFNDFVEDTMCLEATVFNLSQIGELSNKEALSKEFKSENSNIPWVGIYGMRNRIVHDYEGVQKNIVWDTVKNDIPNLEKELVAILSQEQ